MTRRLGMIAVAGLLLWFWRCVFECGRISILVLFSFLSTHTAYGMYAEGRRAKFTSLLLRGTITNRTYGAHETLYISLFLLTRFVPI